MKTLLFANEYFYLVIGRFYPEGLEFVGYGLNEGYRPLDIIIIIIIITSRAATSTIGSALLLLLVLLLVA